MKATIVALGLLLVLVSAVPSMPGGVNIVDSSQITPEVLEIEKFLRQTYPGLLGAETVEVTQQVVSGVVYCLKFRLLQGTDRKICVWSRPWLKSLEVVTKGLEDLKPAIITDLSKSNGN